MSPFGAYLIARQNQVEQKNKASKMSIPIL